ncbi:hypothetical protein KY345_06995 [Candidatus Woesearchaeota archaeon]|nr:hypothetical protein [Candidatus Woesearchaeota archaeon]
MTKMKAYQRAIIYPLIVIVGSLGIGCGDKERVDKLELELKRDPTLASVIDDARKKVKHKDVKTNATLGDIISNPKLYEGKTVVVEGTYGGWLGDLPCDYNKMVMMYKSDAIIYDSTGCLYVTVGAEYLDNEKGRLNPRTIDLGTKIKIRSVVSIVDGKPILGSDF